MDNKTYKCVGRRGAGSWGRPKKGGKVMAVKRIRATDKGKVRKLTREATHAELMNAFRL